MNKHRLFLLMIGIFIIPLLLNSSAVFAHKKTKNFKDYKDACIEPLSLKGGLYLGIQGGYDLYRVVDDANITIVDAVDGFATNTTVDPRLMAAGGIMGGFIGYGMYFSQFYNTYLGIEAFGAFSAARTDYELLLDNLSRLSNPDHLSELKTHVEGKSNWGVDFIPGIKLNPATLFYVRLGYNWSNIDIKQTVIAKKDSTSLFFPQTNTKLEEMAEPGGFHYGVGIEYAIYEGISVRAEYTHTDLSDFDASNNDPNNVILTEISAADNQFMLGVIYHLG